MPRRIPTYLPEDGFSAMNLLSSVGAALLGIGTLVFAYDVVVSVVRRRPAPPDPWGGQNLEWATSSPPPPLNFDERHPLPPIRSHTPLLDLRREREQAREGGSG
jgi:cytochrome c oxidase subunit 1